MKKARKPIRRTTITIAGVMRDEGRWLVNGKNRRGRSLKFTTTRSGLSKGQKVTVTYHIAKKDGTLTGARFASLENVVVVRKEIEGRQVRTRTRSFTILLAEILQEFRDGLGGRHGKILIEGFVVEVVPEKQSWFRTPDGQHHVFGRNVAAWMLTHGTTI